MNQNNGLIRLLSDYQKKKNKFIKEISKKKSIIWNGNSQMTGDEIQF